MKCFRCGEWDGQQCGCKDRQTIFHGDCRELLPELPKVDLVLTDPPYGYGWKTNYSRFSKGLSDKPEVSHDKSGEICRKFIFDIEAEAIVFGANCLIGEIPQPGSFLVWDKRCVDGFSFLSDGEAAWWSEGRGVYIFSKNGQQARSQAGLHPTQKPIKLFRWCLEKAKAKGCVLDPFMGSGTTLQACKDLARQGIGIEIEEKYCEIAANRLRQAVLDFD